MESGGWAPRGRRRGGELPTAAVTCPQKLAIYPRIWGEARGVAGAMTLLGRCGGWRGVDGWRYERSRRVRRLSTGDVEKGALVWMSWLLWADGERWRDIGKSDSGYAINHLDWVGVSEYTRMETSANSW